MALLQCPECRKEVSDQADRCPNCGFPIKNNNDIQVYLSRVKHLTGYCRPQDVIISCGNTILWKGKSGDIATFNVNCNTNIEIRYVGSASDFPGKCLAQIKPTQYKKYSVVAIKSILHTKLMLQPVDYFSVI